MSNVYRDLSDAELEGIAKRITRQIERLTSDDELGPPVELHQDDALAYSAYICGSMERSGVVGRRTMERFRRLVIYDDVLCGIILANIQFAYGMGVLATRDERRG